MNSNKNIFNFNHNIMSRRKQSNPKPLLKRDDEGEFENEQNASNVAAESETNGEESKDSKSPMHEVSAVFSDSETEATKIPESGGDNDIDENSLSPIPMTKILPTLRLNVALASDPATNPDAKEIHSDSLKNIDQEYDSMGSSRNEDAETQVSLSKITLSDEKQQQQQQQNLVMPKSKENISNVGNLIAKNIELMRPNVFMCTPCGIRFSSLSTLEAHCTYYCSHRKIDENALKNSSNAETNGGEPPTKAIKTGKQYACTQCSYSADKKVSLNRHMRMHQTSPTPSSTTSNGDEGSNPIVVAPQIITPVTQPIIDRYCSNCDIRFSSTKTYRAHKQHYCSSRHQSLTPAIIPTAVPSNSTTTGTPKPPKSGSQSPSETTKTPPTPSSQPFLALPTNPVIIMPYSLIRNASIIPGPLSSVAQNTNPESACFLFQNGTLQPIAYILPQAPPNLNSQSQSTQQTSSSKASTTSQATALNHESKSSCRPPSSGSGEVLKSINKRDGVTSRDVSTPLDLSVRRISPMNSSARERSLSLSSAVSAEQYRMEFDAMMEGKENMSVSGESITPEQIVCAPSLPGSPPLTPSPKRRSNSPRSSNVSISPNSSNSHHPILMRPLLPADIALRLSDPALNVILNKQSMELALRMTSSTGSAEVAPQQVSPSPILKSPTALSTPTTIAPQVFVKTGMSKCKECNIVFCKYENYVAHKKHYCSARNLEDNGNNVKVSPPPASSTSSSSNLPIPPQTYQQLICMACGVKFASRDNLNAHQTYYCPKRNELEVQASAAAAAAINVPTSQKEKSQNCVSITGQYKCPMCDVVSPNSNEARKHIETHGGVKAFRCTICRYKGNTLRGMRTHIRMHIDKKSGDLNEENFISCILEDSEVLPVATNNKTPPRDRISNSDLSEAQKIDGIYTKPDTKDEHAKEFNEMIIENSSSIKKEPQDEREQDENMIDETSLIPENIIPVKTEDKMDFLLDEKASPDSITIDDHHNSPSESNSSTLEKYCSNCDIVFTYENTFLAHKKFYCKSIKSDNKSPNTNVTVSLAEASAL